MVILKQNGKKIEKKCYWIKTTFINSAIITVLFIALPIALSAISLAPFSCTKFTRWTDEVW